MRRFIVFLGAILVAIWGGSGLAQMHLWSDDGYSAGGQGIVSRVEGGGPAEVAGLRVGDEILNIDGTPAADLPAPPRRTQPGIGESQTLEIRRAGVTTTIELILAPYSESYRLARVLGGIVALSFLGAAVWVSLTVASLPGLLFSAFGLLQAFSMVEGPFAGSLEGFAGLAEVTAGVASLSVLIHIFLVIPRPRKVLDWPHLHKALYGPLLVFLILGIGDLILDPAFYLAFGAATLVSVFAYLMLLLWTMGHGWLSARPEERRESGMGIMLIGMGIALVPQLLRLVPSFLLPDFLPSGTKYFSLFAVAIPISMALAIRKHQASLLESHPSPAR